jgi:hypothetical protein
VKRGGSLSFLVGKISNVLVMEIGWTDVGSGGYIIVILVFIAFILGFIQRLDSDISLLLFIRMPNE